MAIVRIVLSDAKCDNGFDRDKIRKAENPYAHQHFLQKIREYDGGLDFLIGRPYDDNGWDRTNLEQSSQQHGHLVVTRRSSGPSTFGLNVIGKSPVINHQILVGRNEKGEDLYKPFYGDPDGLEQDYCNTIASW